MPDGQVYNLGKTKLTKRWITNPLVIPSEGFDGIIGQKPQHISNSKINYLVKNEEDTIHRMIESMPSVQIIYHNYSVLYLHEIILLA